MSDDLRERVARALKAAGQMRLALAGQVSFDTAAYAWDAVAEDADAALAEMGRVRVKTLQWWQSDTGDWCVNCELGRYHIGAETDGTWRLDYAYHKKSDIKKPRSFTDIESAKAAAQADYEARILAAIDPAPVSVREAARPTCGVMASQWEGDTCPECGTDFSAALRAIAEGKDEPSSDP